MKFRMYIETKHITPALLERIMRETELRLAKEPSLVVGLIYDESNKQIGSWELTEN